MPFAFCLLRYREGDLKTAGSALISAGWQELAPNCHQMPSANYSGFFTCLAQRALPETGIGIGGMWRLTHGGVWHVTRRHPLATNTRGLILINALRHSQVASRTNDFNACQNIPKWQGECKSQAHTHTRTTKEFKGPEECVNCRHGNLVKHKSDT